MGWKQLTQAKQWTVRKGNKEAGFLQPGENKGGT